MLPSSRQTHTLSSRLFFLVTSFLFLITQTTNIHLSCCRRYSVSPLPCRTNSQISCPSSWSFRPSQSYRHCLVRTPFRSRIQHFKWRQSQLLYPVRIYITCTLSLLTSSSYDKIVIAVGSSSSTHGVPGLENCLQLKTIGDAQSIRRRIMGMILHLLASCYNSYLYLDNFELASLPTTSPEDRKRLLSFVICGGGPTGVETAAVGPYIFIERRYLLFYRKYTIYVKRTS